ncbi:MAG: ABC transporter ATP-binding protein [Planctomycetaceae bacterium]|nr:ABC transporter ATP-binding protein [Planctomycetaceae bacterium]
MLDGKDALSVNPWVRLARYLWPHRRQVILSLMFGVVAAALWGAELLLTFPMVTVFVEGRSLDTYLREEVAAAQADMDEATTNLDQLAHQIAALVGKTGQEHIDHRVALLKEQSRQQRKLNQSSWHLWALTWAQSQVMPWLPRDAFRLLVVLFGLLVVTTLLKGACCYGQDLWAGSLAELCVIDLRAAMFRQLLRQDPQSIELESGPRLLSGMTYDLQGLAHGLTTVGGRIVREPLKALVCIGAAFSLNWQLTTLSLLFVPLAGWLFHQLGRRLKRAVHRVLDTMARIYRFLEQTFSNSRVVLAYQMQGPLRREFQQQNRSFYRQSLKIVKIDALTNPITEFFGMLAVIVAVLPGAYLVLRNTQGIWGIRLSNGPLSVSELITLYALLVGVLDPVRKFSKYFTTIKQCGSSLERVFAQMDRPTLVQQAETAAWLPPLMSSVEFRDVHFHYAGQEAQTGERAGVLHDVSLTIHAGQTVAFVGPNGSGKSTLVGLLPRFYDPTEGAVLIDGNDLRSVRLRDLRRQIALVPQEAALFDNTIAENIRYGRPEATREEILSAAAAAHVLEFSEQFPEGLETRVGERGRALSGGQRQRVALARAFLRNPRILILDEPTAAIDAHSEQLIHHALQKFLQGRTAFLITHQLGPAALAYVTKIVVLDRGQVVGVGSHAELRETCPIYQRLCGVSGRLAA